MTPRHQVSLSEVQLSAFRRRCQSTALEDTRGTLPVEDRICSSGSLKFMIWASRPPGVRTSPAAESCYPARTPSWFTVILNDSPYPAVHGYDPLHSSFSAHSLPAAPLTQRDGEFRQADDYAARSFSLDIPLETNSSISAASMNLPPSFVLGVAY